MVSSWVVFVLMATGVIIAKIDDTEANMSRRMGCLLLLFILATASLVLLTSCTISFHNVSTHGPATDLIDENQSTSPTVSTDMNLPVVGRLLGG